MVVMRAAPFPDWPDAGDRDLRGHDRPHPASNLEWWYLNLHFELGDRGTCSAYVAFFAHDLETERGDRFGYALTWGLCLPDGKRTYESRIDPRIVSLGVERIDEGRGPRDPRMSEALRAVLAQGEVPRPDRVLRHAEVNPDRLCLDFDGNRLEATGDGYTLRLRDPDGRLECDLELRPEKPPVRHGDGGVVSQADHSRMFYYFIPRCGVRGTVLVDGERHPVEAGVAWYDHEFGVLDAGEGRVGAAHDVSWNWLSVQLDNGWDLTIYALFDKAGRTSTATHAVLVDPSGRRSELEGITFDPVRSWTSTRTFNSYPVKWSARAAGLELEVEALGDDHEVLTLLSMPAFWEGPVKVTGSMNGRQVGGRGFVERNGFDGTETMEGFLSAAGQRTRAAAREVLGGDKHPGVIAPLRDIVERGGKAWRSYALLGAIDLVNGDSQRFASWLALPEILHSGALIVDDIEDRSAVRRGGPAAHLVYGQARALNAGCAAYFLWERLARTARLAPEARVRIYELFFDAMRDGHVGQGLDIQGFEHLMPEVVATGDTRELEALIVEVHRLKSGTPAGAMARVGALLGGGSDAQIDGLGALFESLGTSFQIVDDVLNLRGFEKDLKTLGEDLTEGKITLPVAKAMGRLGAAERARLWEGLKARPPAGAELQSLIRTIDGSGALDACLAQAEETWESAWSASLALFPPSHGSLRLRAFGSYVLNRHY